MKPKYTKELAELDKDLDKINAKIDKINKETNLLFLKLKNKKVKK